MDWTMIVMVLKTRKMHLVVPSIILTKIVMATVCLEQQSAGVSLRIHIPVSMQMTVTIAIQTSIPIIPATTPIIVVMEPLITTVTTRKKSSTWEYLEAVSGVVLVSVYPVRQMRLAGSLLSHRVETLGSILMIAISALTGFAGASSSDLVLSLEIG